MRYDVEWLTELIIFLKLNLALYNNANLINQENFKDRLKSHPVNINMDTADHPKMMLKKANQYLYVAFEILNMPTIIDNAITYAHHIIILLTRIKQAITSLQIAEVEHLLPLLTKENRNIIDILLFLREENFLGHLAIPIFVDVLFIDEQQFSDIALLETHSLVDLTVYFHQVKMLRLLVDAGANVTQTYPFLKDSGRFFFEKVLFTLFSNKKVHQADWEAAIREHEQIENETSAIFLTKNVANNNYQNNQSMRPSKTSQFLTSDQYETALLAQLGKACLACMNITHKAYPGFNHASLNAGLFAKLGAFYLDMVKDPSIIIPDELVEQICRLKQATLFWYNTSRHNNCAKDFRFFEHKNIANWSLQMLHVSEKEAETMKAYLDNIASNISQYQLMILKITMRLLVENHLVRPTTKPDLSESDYITLLNAANKRLKESTLYFHLIKKNHALPDKVFFYQNGQFHFRDYFNPLEKVITYVNQSLVLEAMQTGADDGSNQKIQQILNTAYKAGLLTNDDIELADEYYQLNLTPTQQL